MTEAGTEYPEEYVLSGLPFMLQGWNGRLYRTFETSDGVPIYRMDPYTLYYIFPIYGIDLKRVDGKWVIKRFIDNEGTYVLQKCRPASHPDPTPVGNWPYNSQISLIHN